MRNLHCNEYVFISGGASSGCEECDRLELEKECRDDLNTGFAMGALAGASLTKHPFGTGIGALLGGAAAARLSSECQALANAK